MIFLDTNVIIDLIELPHAASNAWARQVMTGRDRTEQLVCNLVVVAELAGHLGAPALLQSTFDLLELSIVPMDTSSALLAGAAFRDYRRRGGARTAILADFLIGGHAASLGATLMTRDRKLARYFPDLRLLTPDPA